MTLIKTFSHLGDNYEIFKEDKVDPNGNGVTRHYHLKKNSAPCGYDLAEISHEIINDSITQKSPVDLEEAVCIAIEGWATSPNGHC